MDLVVAELRRIVKIEDKQYLAQQLVIILQDNVGQRLTVALANGILAQFEAVIQIDAPSTTSTESPAQASG